MNIGSLFFIGREARGYTKEIQIGQHTGWLILLIGFADCLF